MAADMLAKIKRTGDRRDARRPKDEGPIEPMRPGAIPYQMLNRERDSMRRTRQESVFTVPKLR